MDDMPTMEVLLYADRRLLGTVLLPRVSELPDVLAWGERLFVPFLMASQAFPAYREVFPVSVPRSPDTAPTRGVL